MVDFILDEILIQFIIRKLKHMLDQYVGVRNQLQIVSEENDNEVSAAQIQNIKVLVSQVLVLPVDLEFWVWTDLVEYEAEEVDCP